MDRRELLATIGSAAGWAALGFGRRATASPQATVRDIKVISRQPNLYHGWPTLIRCRSRRLLVAYSGGREAHVCPFGRLESIESTDDGATWSDAKVVMDSVIDDRDAGLLETATGALLATTFTSLAYADVLKKAEKFTDAKAKETWRPERLDRWREFQTRSTPEQREAMVGVWMLRSTDGGATWSAPYDCLVDSPHGPIQLADGRLLYAGKDIHRSPNRTGVCESSDDGRTWRWLADLPVREGDSRDKYHELHAVETVDGRLVLHIRNHNKTNESEVLQSESSDGGSTWSTPHTIGVWGYPSHLLRLKDGRLLMTYGHRRPPLGNQARLSEDGGRTWSEAMIISDDGTYWDLGYPSTVELGDGSLLTVWYENMAGERMTVLREARAVLRQARWTCR